MRQRVGIARALVAEPKILCLDEAFSALDVLTAENLRNEVVTLWKEQATSLKSIFMVTHNIEEAVEMATRICVLFPHPGRLGLVMENSLAYPRNPHDPEFERLVNVIHETITMQALPDHPPEPAPGFREAHLSSASATGIHTNRSRWTDSWLAEHSAGPPRAGQYLRHR